MIENSSIGDPSRLIPTLSGRVGLLTTERQWVEMKRWVSFSAEFVLFQSQDDRFLLKLGSNWSGDDVGFVVSEIGRVGAILTAVPDTQLAMPGVLGSATSPPAIALEYLDGDPIFDVIAGVDDGLRRKLLTACGRAIGAFHSAETIGTSDELTRAAREEMVAVGRRMGFRAAGADRHSRSLVCARSFRFSPNDFLVDDVGTVILLDPPHVRKYAYVHRDIGTFVMELHRALLGERMPRNDGESARLSAAVASFVGGYADTGPTTLTGPSDVWAIRVFAAARVAGVAANRFRRFELGNALRTVRWAAGLRRTAKHAR